MESRKCLVCQKKAFSAAAGQVWECPHCSSDIPIPEDPPEGVGTYPQLSKDAMMEGPPRIENAIAKIMDIIFWDVYMKADELKDDDMTEYDDILPGIRPKVEDVLKRFEEGCKNAKD